MPTLTIPTAELVGTLADVVPFASTDTDLETLNAVHLEWDGERLHAYGTDLYASGWSTWHPEHEPLGPPAQDDLLTHWGTGDDTPWETTLALADAIEITKVFKLPAKEGRIPLSMTVGDDRILVRRARELGHSALMLEFGTRGDVTFPPVRDHVAASERFATATREIRLDSKRLAQFARVRNHGPFVLYLAGEEYPALVRIGTRFTGLIHPEGTDVPEEPPAAVAVDAHPVDGQIELVDA